MASESGSLDGGGSLNGGHVHERQMVMVRTVAQGATSSRSLFQFVVWRPRDAFPEVEVSQNANQKVYNSEDLSIYLLLSDMEDSSCTTCPHIPPLIDLDSEPALDDATLALLDPRPSFPTSNDDAVCGPWTAA
jgi:hypothetical protein